MDMIERVARALCRQYEIDDGYSPEQADKSAAGAMFVNFIPAAYAAVEAMREPTPEMIDVGWRLIRGNLRPDEIYPHMIDAALKSAPGGGEK